jgi:hypothetical protein
MGNRCIQGRPDGKRPLGGSRLSWEDNIKVGLQEVEWRGMDYLELAQDKDRWWALLNVIMNLQVP